MLLDSANLFSWNHLLRSTILTNLLVRGVITTLQHEGQSSSVSEWIFFLNLQSCVGCLIRMDKARSFSPSGYINLSPVKEGWISLFLLSITYSKVYWSEHFYIFSNLSNITSTCLRLCQDIKAHLPDQPKLLLLPNHQKHQDHSMHQYQELLHHHQNFLIQVQSTVDTAVVNPEAHIVISVMIMNLHIPTLMSWIKLLIEWTSCGILNQWTGSETDKPKRASIPDHAENNL